MEGWIPYLVGLLGGMAIGFDLGRTSAMRRIAAGMRKVGTFEKTLGRRKAGDLADSIDCGTWL